MTTEPSLQSMATVLHRDAMTGLRFARTFRHPPERVWRAITESEHLAQWFPCDIVGDRVPGAPLRFPFWPEVVEKFSIDDNSVTGSLLAWDPPRRFAFVWGGDEVRFDLTDSGDVGTTLTLTTWLASDVPPPHDVASGYHTCLGHLIDVVDHGGSVSVAHSDPAPLTAHYEATWDALDHVDVLVRDDEPSAP
jgi:uncharacterized protein YndB with AHSA1/START domain